MIYRILPQKKLGMSDLWIGAGMTSLLFALGQMLIGWYIRQTDLGSAYGAIGSITVLFVWIFYSTLIFLYGAVFTRMYSERFGTTHVVISDS